MQNTLLFLCAWFLLCQTQAQTFKGKITSQYSVEYTCPPCGCPEDGKTFDGPGVCATCNMSYNSRLIGMENKPRITSPRRTVAILLFNRADIMDVTGPMSVFEHAGFNVITVAKNKEQKQIGSSVRLAPDYTFETLPRVDVIMVPGGGPAESDQDMDIVQWLKKRQSETDTMFSVCSGAFFLGLAGILDNNEATTFASLIPNLRDQFPKAQVLNNVKYTNNGHVVTSSGLSSGIDASFEVVAKYYGIGRAQDIANRMEYPWKRRNDYARSQLADNFIMGIGGLIRRFATKYYHSEGDMNSWEYRYVLWEGVEIKDFMALISQELQKLPQYEMKSNGDNVIRGTYNHPSLGRATIEVKLSEQNGIYEASISAKRIKKLVV